MKPQHQEVCQVLALHQWFPNMDQDGLLTHSLRVFGTPTEVVRAESDAHSQKFLNSDTGFEVG